MMNRMQKIFGPTGLQFFVVGLLLALPACSRPTPEPHPTEIFTEVEVSYYVPDLSDVITFSPVVVIATVEPTTITYNWYEPKPMFEGFLRYRLMRLYILHIENYLRGSGEAVLYMGWEEGDTIMARTQEELEVLLAADTPDAPPLEAGKRYLLFLSKHAFDYRPKELDLDIFYEGSTPLSAFEITESGETIPVLISALRNSENNPGWTLDEFILYINRPELIPTRTPLPTQELVEPYPFAITPTLDPLIPYPFPMGTPLPYGAYPEP